MASDPRLLAGLAAGLASAVLAMWAFRGMPGGAMSLWVVPMPLFMAGIGFGPAAVLMALGTAVLAMLLMGSSLGLGLFLAAFGVPAVLLVLVSRQGPAPEARQGVSLGLPLALLGAIPAAGVLGAASIFADIPGGLDGAMREAAQVGLQQMGLPASDALVDTLIRIKAAAIGFWLAIALLVNAAAGAALLVRFGAIAQAPAWREARLPGWYLALPAIALGLWLLDDAEDATTLSLLLVLLVPVFLQGLAAFHRATRAIGGRPLVLGGAYAALLLISVPMAFVATGYGFYDILNGTRARRAAPPRS